MASMGARPKWKVTGAKLGSEDASEVAPYPSEKWLKPGPESGLDCFICAMFARPLDSGQGPLPAEPLVRLVWGQVFNSQHPGV